MYWTPLYTQASTNNINDTRGLLQTTEGKDEQKIVFHAELVTDITTRYSEPCSKLRTYPRFKFQEIQIEKEDEHHSC